MSNAWAKGSTARWRRIRAAVLLANAQENKGRCVLQIKGVCTGLADCVHHVLGRSVTGDDPRYLVAACRACNLAIGEPGRGPKPKRVSRW